MKKIILGTVVIFMLGGVALYFWLNSGGDDGFGFKLPGVSSPVAPSPLVAGCGNGLCEEGENFNSCPVDCYSPGSSGPELAKLALSSADFPSPPLGTSWVKIYDKLSENDESSIWPTLQNHKALAIHNMVIALSAPDGLSWAQWGHVAQFILAYPQDKILNAFEAATGNDIVKFAAQAKISLQELPDPTVGEISKAFKITGQGDTFYVIFFVKKGFLEYITFRGEKYEYQAFPPLARKAAEKIK